MAKPTPKVKMVWTGVPRTQQMHRRENGQEFYATRSQAKVYRALGWAQNALAQVGDLAVQQPPDTLETLRSQYQTTVGRRPFHGWGADQLREKIDQARYQRRDMRAED